jgi:hypothetical protein
MSTAPTVTPPQQPPQRPQLEVRLEQLEQRIIQLKEATRLYRRMKAMLTQVHEDPNHTVVTECNLQIVIDDLAVPVPMPQDQQQRISYIEEGTSFLGEDVIRLWNEIHQITTEAAAHCAAAAQRAAAAAAGQQHAPPPAVPPSPVA